MTCLHNLIRLKIKVKLVKFTFIKTLKTNHLFFQDSILLTYYLRVYQYIYNLREKTCEEIEKEVLYLSTSWSL